MQWARGLIGMTSVVLMVAFAVTTVTLALLEEVDVKKKALAIAARGTSPPR